MPKPARLIMGNPTWYLSCSMVSKPRDGREVTVNVPPVRHKERR